MLVPPTLIGQSPEAEEKTFRIRLLFVLHYAIIKSGGKNHMKEYTLVAELTDAEGGEWTADAGITATDNASAVRQARIWAKAEAKAQNAKLVAFYAQDTQGVAHS